MKKKTSVATIIRNQKLEMKSYKLSKSEKYRLMLYNILV